MQPCQVLFHFPPVSFGGVSTLQVVHQCDCEPVEGARNDVRCGHEGVEGDMFCTGTFRNLLPLQFPDSEGQRLEALVA